ncbi:MAG: hypothetical protein IKY39_01890 [Clostridia bacterium]|nr:hypothetical protein [Clostridia bacterium]
MNAAAYIRECVTMTDICRQYGFRINSSGFVVCPFHTEKTASLKIYPGGRGWCCFGCGAKGSVIDFVELLFGVGFAEAIKIIDRDFGLGLTTNKKSDYRQREMLRRKISEAERKRAELAAEREKIDEGYNELLTEYICCDLIIMALTPKHPDDELDENYVRAMQKRPVIEFELDCYNVGGEIVE